MVRGKVGSYLQMGDFVLTSEGALAQVKSLDGAKGTALLDPAPQQYVQMYGAKPLASPLTWYEGKTLKRIWNPAPTRALTNERRAAAEDAERKSQEYLRQAGLLPR
jgi:hypothetical protein